jgi:hypothetical protein
MLTLRKLIKLYEDVDPEMSLDLFIHYVTIKSLSPKQKDVYDLVVTDHPVTSGDVVQKLGISKSHAGNILKTLHNLELLVAGIAAEKDDLIEYTPLVWLGDEDGTT